MQHPFARAAFDVTQALGDNREHVVALKVTPMPHPGTPGDKSSNGNTFVQSANLYLDAPTYLAVSGWDWMPAVRDRVTGIWDHVRLRSTGVAVVGDPHIATTVASTKPATVTVSVPIRNVAQAATTVTVRAGFDGVKLAKTVTVAAGATATVTFAPVTMQNPKLWLPNGYGDANLHDLSVTATVSGKTSDHRTTRFGIREFGYDWDQPIVVSPPGKPPLEFENDVATQTVTFDPQHARFVRVLAGHRATGWGVSMWTLSVADGDGPDLALHKAAESSSDDGNAWTDVKAFSNDTPIGDTATQTVDIAQQTARYVRIQGGKRVTSWGISMWTLSVLDSAGTDLALHTSATASSDDGNGPGNAIDGDPRTRWSSSYQDNRTCGRTRPGCCCGCHIRRGTAYGGCGRSTTPRRH